jgi:DHA1 family tetracycline resistance protein-like MFS transporter
MFLQRLAHGSLPAIFVLYVDYRYHWTLSTISNSLAAVGILQMIVSGGLVRPAIRRLGERGTLLLGLSCGITGFLIYASAATVPIFLVSFPFIALWGLANPALQSMSTRFVTPREQGQLQGAQSSFASIADMIGPLIFSQAFAAAIVNSGIYALPGVPYYLAALFVTFALIVCWGILRPAIAAAE